MTPHRRRTWHPARLRALAIGVISVVSGVTAAADTNAIRSLHPVDGPHADPRFTLTDETIVLKVGVNLAMMDEMVDVPREAIDSLSPIETEVLGDAVAERVMEGCTVVADGVKLEPTLSPFAFQFPDRGMLPLFPKTGMRGLIRASGELTFDLPTSTVETIEVRWPDYPADLLGMEMEGGNPRLIIQSLFSAEGVVHVINFSETEPTWTWTRGTSSPLDRMLLVPPVPQNGPTAQPSWMPPPLQLAGFAGAAFGVIGLISLVVRGTHRRAGGRLVCVGFSVLSLASLVAVVVGGDIARKTAADAFTRADADTTFRALHRNIYRAFDFTAESDVYDALERSVSGDLLGDLYERIYRSLVMMDHEGAVGRVTSVSITSVAIGAERADTVANAASLLSRDENGLYFDVTSEWQVEGTVYHWGHSHTRTYDYTADFRVRDVDGVWRITEQTVTARTRIPGVGDPLDQPDPRPWVPGTEL